jgi:hypothetical protein
VVTCLSATPQTIDAMLSLIETCAEAAGGPGWASLAITGAQAALVMFVVAALVGVVVGRVR